MPNQTLPFDKQSTIKILCGLLIYAKSLSWKHFPHAFSQLCLSFNKSYCDSVKIQSFFLFWQQVFILQSKKQQYKKKNTVSRNRSCPNIKLCTYLTPIPIHPNNRFTFLVLASTISLAEPLYCWRSEVILE